MIRYVFMALFLAWQAGLLAWLLRRRALEPIKSRGVFMVCFGQVAAAALFLVLSCYGELSDANAGFSCVMPGVVNALIIPFWFMPYLARCFKLYYMHALNDARTNGRFDPDLPEGRWLVQNRWLLNKRVWVAIMLAFAVLSIAILLMIMYINPDIPAQTFVYQGVPGGCYGRYTYIVVGEGVAAIVASIFFCFFLYRVRDNFGLKEELRNMLITEIPVVILFAVQGIIPSKFPRTLPNHAWALIAFVLGSFNSLLFPIWLSYREFYKLSPQDAAKSRASSTAGTLTADTELGTTHERVPLDELNPSTLLRYILKDHDLALAFKRFAAQSWCVENIFFYQDARRYSELRDPTALHAEGWRMFRVYFDVNAPMAINIDESTLEHVYERVIAGDFTSDMFKESEAKVYLMLKTDTLKKWRQTRGFVEAVARSPLADLVLMPELPAPSTLRGTLRDRISPLFAGGRRTKSEPMSLKALAALTSSSTVMTPTLTVTPTSSTELPRDPTDASPRDAVFAPAPSVFTGSHTTSRSASPRPSVTGEV